MCSKAVTQRAGDTDRVQHIEGYVRDRDSPSRRTG